MSEENNNQPHKYTQKRIKDEVAALQRLGYDISVEANGVVRFATRSGRYFPGRGSEPMAVEEAKFFLWGYLARCGR